MQALIVFSHLRWDFVYQRPQHLLGRIASRWPVVFVEEPERGDVAELSVSTPAPGVTVLRPRTPIDAWGFDDAQVEAIAPLLRAWLESNDVADYGAWLYTPMALPLLTSLSPRVVVYDCMDELTGFRGAPAQLAARERSLLEAADVVFTGGPSLFDARRDRHPNVHCVPSSVDAAHFARAADPSHANPLFDGMARPRLGFYGVIDERLDLGLLEALADADQDWQVCVVGPVVKIDPASLPRRDNLHWLPRQDYADLPSMLAAWDVCLLPFALNEATKFISPTKTLEYMCAGKPVVSTAIEDVRRLYGSGVAIARDAEGFIAASRDALAETPQAERERREAQQVLIGGTSWDAAAALVVREIEAACALRPAAQRRESARERVVPLASAAQTRQPAFDEEVECLIIGAGPTGLSAAYHYGKGSLLVDANAQVGGWCRSIEDKGFVFDYAGHIMFSKDPYVHGLYATLLGDNVHWQDREAWVYSKGVHTRYPFQGALYGLPPQVLKECIVGAIEARFGSLHDDGGKAPAETVRGAKSDAPSDCCADGIAPDPKDSDTGTRVTALPPAHARAPRNFEEFIYRTWGAGVAKHFAVPYNRKLWAVPLSEMETSWLGGRVPLPDLEEMIEGALQPVAKPQGPNARFGYPLRGGFQALMDGFLPLLRGELRLSTRVLRVDATHRIAHLDDGRRVRYRTLVSTAPLPDLVRMLGDDASSRVRNAAAGLRHVSVRCVNLGVAREAITDKHWIYYPEETVFHRIFVQGNASPHTNPKGGFGLTCEITYSPHKPLPCDGAELIQRCIEDCRAVGMLRDDDRIATANLVDMPYAYVVYDHARASNVAAIRDWMAERDIVLAGRYSEWEYYNSDHAFIAGKRAAETALPQRRGARSA
jgi:UDP-galactopyranose mutase